MEKVKNVWLVERIVAAFAALLLCLDIETECIGGKAIMIGASRIVNNAYEHLTLVEGIDLNRKRLRKMFNGIKVIVTFNGTIHDLQELEKMYPGILPKRIIHIDLYWLSGLLGLKMGFKELERFLDIKRPQWAQKRVAVKLWQQYKRTEQVKYLNKLRDYNYWDCVNQHKVLNKLISMVA